MLKWVLIISAVFSALIVWVFISELRDPNFLPIDLKIQRPAAQGEIIDVLHQYKDGVHRLSGSIQLPHSCFLVTRNGEVVGVGEERAAEIRMTTLDRSKESANCAFIPTKYDFDIVLDAYGTLPVKVYVDGTLKDIREENLGWDSPKVIDMKRNGTL